MFGSFCLTDDVVIFCIGYWIDADVCVEYYQECRGLRIWVSDVSHVGFINENKDCCMKSQDLCSTTLGLVFLSGRALQFPVVSHCGLIKRLCVWCNDGCITWQPKAMDLVFSSLFWPLSKWLSKISEAVGKSPCIWTGHNCTSHSLLYLHYLEIMSYYQTFFFPVQVLFSPPRFYLVSWFSSLKLKKGLILPEKDRGHALVFVISSLESLLLPLHKKEESVQSTLFFMSNARQMWPACGDSHCSLYASTAVSLPSLILFWQICLHTLLSRGFSNNHNNCFLTTRFTHSRKWPSWNAQLKLPAKLE